MTARRVLVTGANSGIGLAIALRLAGAGHDVVGTVRSANKAKTLQAAARERGVTVQSRLLDVTDAERCEQVIDEIKPDVLVNNAGYGMSAAVEHVPDEDARRLLETMVIAPIRLARLVLPHMRQQGWGRIINISSILGRVTMPLSGWYQASKHALEAVTDALRIEVGGDRVKVVLIEPGFFRTSIFEELRSDAQRYGSERYAKAYERAIEGLEQSQRLMGDPDQVARTVQRVINNPWPRARYTVGTDAQILELTRWFQVPEITDFLMRRGSSL